jgi:hypothetical protein
MKRNKSKQRSSGQTKKKMTGGGNWEENCAEWEGGRRMRVGWGGGRGRGEEYSSARWDGGRRMGGMGSCRPSDGVRRGATCGTSGAVEGRRLIRLSLCVPRRSVAGGRRQGGAPRFRRACSVRRGGVSVMGRFRYKRYIYCTIPERDGFAWLQSMGFQSISTSTSTRGSTIILRIPYKCINPSLMPCQKQS